jgi:hypothetical protein
MAEVEVALNQIKIKDLITQAIRMQNLTPWD